MAPFSFTIKYTKEANDSNSKIEDIPARQYEHFQMRLVRESEDLHPQTPKCFCKSRHTRPVSDCVKCNMTVMTVMSTPRYRSEKYFWENIYGSDKSNKSMDL